MQAHLGVLAMGFTEMCQCAGSAAHRLQEGDNDGDVVAGAARERLRRQPLCAHAGLLHCSAPQSPFPQSVIDVIQQPPET